MPLVMRKSSLVQRMLRGQPLPVALAWSLAAIVSSSARTLSGSNELGSTKLSGLRFVAGCQVWMMV
jgi:hypothetical protein